MRKKSLCRVRNYVPEGIEELASDIVSVLEEVEGECRQQYVVWIGLKWRRIGVGNRVCGKMCMKVDFLT